MRRLVAGVVTLVALGTLVDPAGAADRRVNHQAWAQSQMFATFMAQPNELYVAVTAGIEEARSFVHIDVAGLSAGDLRSAKLVLVEATDSLQAAGGAMVACALAGPLSGDGKLATAPPTDCTLRTDATRQDNGHWTLPLGIFADRWARGDNTGLALFPDAPTTGTTYRIALATQDTALDVTTPPSGTGATTTTRPQPALVPFQPLGVYTPATEPVAPAAVTAPSSRGTTVPAVGPSTSPRSTATSGVAAGGSTTGSSVFAMAVLAGVALGVGAIVRRRGPWSLSALPGALPARRGPPLTVAVGALALVLIPMLGREVTVFKFGVVLIFFVAAIGLHVLVNWAGQLSLAHTAMVGVPAFATLTLSDRLGMSPIYLLPVAVLLGAVVGGVIAIPTLRTKDVQVALVTLVAGLAIDRFFFSQSWLVGDAGGRASATPALGPLRFTTSRSLYPVLAVVVIAAVAAAWALMHSKFARAWFWVRADPDAALAFGVPVTAYRIAAYAVGGAFAGLAGGMTVMWIQRLGATAFPFTLSFGYLLIAVLAGPGFVGGLAVATLMLQGGQQFSADLFGSGGGKTFDSILAYGGPLGLISVIARYQEGLNGIGRRLMPRIRGFISRTQGEGQSSEAVPIAMIAGVTAIIAGFFAIYLAWHHISRTDQLWVQNQEILSGGVTGLALVLVGVGLLIRDRLVRNHDLLSRQIERLFASRESSSDADGTAHADAANLEVGDFVALPPIAKPTAAARGTRRQLVADR
ncbi:MAG: branched-chain amino acid transport system permease protein [Solirubrobacteraceae bacterium]|nr:branched-chain amino acid transport system permease protein [Solirubrobacteraceae bacterium]